MLFWTHNLQQYPINKFSLNVFDFNRVILKSISNDFNNFLAVGYNLANKKIFFGDIKIQNISVYGCIEIKSYLRSPSKF